MDERHVGLILDGDKVVGIIPAKKPEPKKPEEKQDKQPPRE